ncbi:MAG: class I SAM-dependent methyltransferase [Bacillota bacterium]|nr:class I SAM-dependent methyltransferase [Bacillota bacterium]
MFVLRKITDLAQHYLELVINPGNRVIDATAGNGYDTEFLARQVGPQGHVYAFDIQAEALKRTAERLRKSNLIDRVTLYETGHEEMSRLIEEPVSAVTYNLGYLPGGDHNLVTRNETTIESLSQALELLITGGLVVITMYPGHAEGNLEKQKLLSFCSKLQAIEFTVVHMNLLNLLSSPPELLIVQKNHFKQKMKA